MEFKSQDIFLYILPGLFLILNLLIFLIGFNYIGLLEVIERVNVASSLLILLLSMIVGYVIQIIYSILMGQHVSSIRISLIEATSLKDQVIDSLRNTLQEMENIGMFFITNVVIFMGVFVTIISSYFKWIQVPDDTNYVVIIVQLMITFLIMIGTFMQIKIKIEEINKVKNLFK